MKKFKELRESYLEEKLKASDPAGTYIHDFVHSDNPKFAGKSKAKRIQMALAASYSAKGKSRNEEVELDEVSKSTLGKYVNKARSDRMDALHSNYRNTDDDYEAAKKDNERVEKRDRGINLARAKINKFGKSGNTIAKVKATEEVETFNEEDSTSLKTTTAGADVIHKDTGNKLGTVYQPTAGRSSHVAVVHGPRGGPERKEFSSFKDAHTHIKKTYGLDEGMLEATKKDAVKQYTDIQKYKPNFNKPKSKPNPEEFLRISLGNTKKQQGVKEGMFDTVKTVAKKMGKALTGGSDQDQLKNLQKKMGLPQTGKKPTSK